MATFGGGTFGEGSTTTAFRYPSFRQTEKTPEDEFDVTKSPLYQQAQNTAQQQLSGNVEGFDTQAQVARETQKATQAATAQAKRAALMDMGMRDTGTYAQEGLITPAVEQERERLDLERNLAAQRQTQIREQQAVGMTGATNLLGLASQEKLGYRGIQSEETMQEKGIASTEKLGFAGIASSEKVAGMEIASREKIAADANWIQQQGVDLNKAQLYGYTDANGNYVAGTAQLAQNYFGLESANVDMARDELYGYVDLTTGQRIQGKIGLMNAQDQREAARLYGYDDENGNHIMGELEIAEDRNAIERAGLDLEEAKAFGYTDDNGEYHAGMLDIEYDRLGLDKSKFEADKLALFGGVNPDTGETVKGSTQIAAERLGLEGETVELQRNELFGYTDPNTGEYTPGKYQMMNNEQQREADELYGYYDKTTGDYVPGKFEQAKTILEIQSRLELELAKAGYDYALISENLMNMEGDQAAEYVKEIAKQYGIDIPDMTNTRTEAGQQAIADFQNQRFAGKGYNLSTAQIENIKAYGAESNMVIDDSGNTLESMAVNQWVDGFGEKNRWTISDNALAWVNANKGMLYEASNGHVYEIIGVDDKNERHYRAGIQFKDLQTNQIVTINDQNGFPAVTGGGV